MHFMWIGFPTIPSVTIGFFDTPGSKFWSLKRVQSISAVLFEWNGIQVWFNLQSEPRESWWDLIICSSTHGVLYGCIFDDLINEGDIEESLNMNKIHLGGVFANATPPML